MFRNEEGDLNDPAEVQRRERLRKKQELQMQFQLKRKGRPKNESWDECVVRPDPAFYCSADPDPGSGSQTNADPDPDPGQTKPSKNFYMKTILLVGHRS